MDKSEITVVIVTYNRLELLKKCVSSVFNQTLKPDNIIIIDNGSTDGTKEYLEAQSDVQIIRQENTGSAGGFKRGIKEAFAKNTEWIALLDDDCEASPDYFERIKSAAENKFAQDNIAGVFSGYVEEPLFVKGRTFHGVVNGEVLEQPVSEIYETEDLGFPFLFVNRKVVEQAGLPYSFWFTINDDSEWIWRIRDKGFKCFITNFKAGKHYNRRDISEGKHFETPFRVYYLTRNAMLYGRVTGRGSFKSIRHGVSRVFNELPNMKNFISAAKGFFSGVAGLLNMTKIMKKEREN